MENNNLNDTNNMSAMERVTHATEGQIDTRVNTLDDEQRIKILSPGMMVFKRFIRNKLAITGFVILVMMFLFSFLGPIFTPYSQTQMFTTMQEVQQNYAGAIFNKELRAITVDGKQIPNNINAKFVLAKNKAMSDFEVNKERYTIDKINEDSYKINKMQKIASIIGRGGKYNYPKNNPLFTEEFILAFENAIETKENKFEFNGKEYNIALSKIEAEIGTTEDYAIMSKSVFNAYKQDYLETINNIDFRYEAELSVTNNKSDFSFDNRNFKIKQADDIKIITEVINGKEENYAIISDLIVNPTDKNAFLDIDFILAVRNAIKTHNNKFTLPSVDESDNTSDVEYKINLTNANYYITSLKSMLLQDIYAAPSSEHLLGTDEKAMDVTTRLMYGGRISLMVGFVVVLIEIIIGVLIGGVSGYFGGWVDTLLMRFVDLFNCIPYWPIMIIVGSVMDTLEIDSITRIFLLMFILGLMGWTGIARIVRGQILMLREQDFMIATEATGLSVNKRIFRHLVPNVMPLLIVQATMSLGGIIITEATLSFLGLGVKPPIASWGSIINAANNIHVMKNCWWVWLPTGFLIVLTVLGFNFVGDGLRDAYDPKMKR